MYFNRSMAYFALLVIYAIAIALFIHFVAQDMRSEQKKSHVSPIQNTFPSSR